MSENQAGWQQRIAAALTAKATHGVLQGPWNDQKREPAILLQDALDTVAEYGQNAVDALPPPKPVRQQCGLCGAFLPNWKDGERILKCGRCGTESVRDALPPAPEVKDSKLSAIDPDTGSDEGMTPLCAYDTKRLMALQPRQDTQALVELWHETRQSYRRGPVILAHVMDLGSKLADALEALSESSASPAQPAEIPIDAIRRIRKERGVSLKEARRIYAAERPAETPEERTIVVWDMPAKVDDDE
jgi:ribosomal protein S27AE